MSIEIKIHHPRDSGVFYGGDDVTGFLEIKGPLNIPDATVKVHFKGCANVEQQSDSREGDDKQIFFQTLQELFRGVIDLQEDEIRTFPFKLLLPDYTEPSWGQPKVRYHGSKGYRDKKVLFAQTPHPIPPSTAFSSTGRCSAQILYSLYAEVRGKRTMRWKAGHVTVVPSPAQVKNTLEHADAEHDARSETFTYTSSRLLEGNTDKRRSMKTWFSDSFASKTPKAVFGFTARTTTVLCSGQGIPIQITLNYDSSVSNLPSIPEFHLLELKYKLKAITHSANPNSGFSKSCHYDTTTFFKRQIRFAKMALTNGQALDIGFIDTEKGGLHYIPFDTAVVTPFTTYNISRRYDAEVIIVFQCAGKQMTAEFQWDNVNIAFNEAYYLRAPTQFATEDDKTFQGAVGVAKVAAVTAVRIAAVLGVL